jgi:hypothetical protein
MTCHVARMVGVSTAGRSRGTDEIDIERSSLMFIDHIVHAAGQALRGSEYSLLLTFGVIQPEPEVSRGAGPASYQRKNRSQRSS